MLTPAPNTPEEARPPGFKTRSMGVLRFIIARIPTRLGNYLADRAGFIVYSFAFKSRHHAISNMAHVLGPGTPRRRHKAVVRGVFRNVMRNYFDLFRAPDMRDEEIDRLVDFDEEGWKRVVAFQESGRAVVLVTAHFGSFDMMTHVISRRAPGLVTLIARVKPAWLSDFIIQLRGARGLKMSLVDEDEGSGTNLGALKNSMTILRHGGLLGVMADRNMESKGVTIKFFGYDTVVAPGVAKIALRTKAAVVPTLCYRLPGDRYSLRFEQPIEPKGSASNPDDIKALLSTIFACLEEHFGRNPEQWVLLQSVWRREPDE